LKIIEVNENEWIPTSRYPLGRFKYEKFNPVQSAFFKIYNFPGHKIIEAATSAGKTTIAEMAIMHHLHNSKKAIVIAPLKALADEKYSDWTSSEHNFSSYKISIVTGDYLPAENRQKVLMECLNSDIMLFTPEMFDSLTRKKTNEIIEWFNSVGVVVIDECHLLTMPWRGSTLENSIIRCFEIANPELVLLSATMTNTEEIAKWLEGITSSEVYLISSDWRPTKLNVHYVPYVNGGGYSQKIETLIDGVLKIINEHPADKFLVFVHSKSLGRKIKEKLEEEGYGEIYFHNADLEAEKKKEIVEKFNNHKLRIIIATSTLAWGVNLPARRVIIVDVTRGMEEVSPIDIKQMIGRAGRYGIDPCGDAYIIYPWNKPKYKNYLNRPENFVIKSRLLDPDEIAFHVVAEINKGKNNANLLREWYEKTLAYHQEMTLIPLQETIDNLTNWGIIEQHGEIFVLNPTGRISAWFYYSPYMVAKLLNNFYLLNMEKDFSDTAISSAIGTALPDYPVSKFALDEAYAIFGNEIPYEKLGATFSIWLLINGLIDKVHNDLINLIRQIQADSERLSSVLKAIEGFYKIDCKSNELMYRLKYGAPAEFIPLLQIKGIGLARAKKLYEAGIKNKEELIMKKDLARKILGKNYDLIIRTINANKFPNKELVTASLF
jgi:helicase